MTSAELAKKNEFYSIYWAEYRSVKDSAGAEISELPDYLDEKVIRNGCVFHNCIGSVFQQEQAVNEAVP